MGPSARLLRLLSLLQTPRDWTGAELAERLDVSTRTVRQDIERLRSLGYPVHANRGAVGGYRLEAGATLPPLLLEDDEAVAVAVGLRTAAGGAVTGIEETSLRALAKVEQVLPSRLRGKVNALQTSTILVTGRPGPTVDAEVLTLLAGTCRDHTGLRFDYEDRKGSASRRTVEPHRLVNAGRRWYLVAWDTDRADWRTFRVDRVRPWLPVGGRFTPRPISDEEVQALVSRGVPPAARRYQARVVVHAPALTIADRIGPWVGTVEADGEDRCILEAGADSLELLAVHLGMLDADFRVTEPPELVGHLRSLAERYGRATAADPSG
jgi:predicted DNA-binding transcriptional regulator YafY